MIPQPPDPTQVVQTSARGKILSNRGIAKILIQAITLCHNSAKITPSESESSEVSRLITDQNSLRRELRVKFPRNHGQLLPALHFLQHEFGYLPDWAMEVVGWHLGIPASEVYGAATSYTELRIQQPRATVVRVCTALSCLTQGAAGILSNLEAELDPSSANSRFTLEETPCGFLCGMAPAIEIDGRWHGRLDPQSAVQLVRNVANG
ncbi:MAG: hypothetical protein F4Y49_10880 [Dehalococcoidia bacterium]|nr:hypothetical protein [Dehalococcoidia bacterium]